MLIKSVLIVLLSMNFLSYGYGFELAGLDLKNDFSVYQNDTGSPYRFAYFGKWKYKDTFFLKTIYRADYSDSLRDTGFSQFIPALGGYFFKNLALMYQYEYKRFHTSRRIYQTNEDRLGFSVELKRQLFSKRVFWFDDIQLFPYESKSDQRIRWAAKLTYDKMFLSDIFYMDIDHSNGRKGIDFSYFLQPTLGYYIYRQKYTDISIRFQFQRQTDKTDIYRIGLGMEF